MTSISEKICETNEMVVSSLVPNALWRHFLTFCEIPRKSGYEKDIADYVLAFAINRGFPSLRDPLHNVIVYKPATPGYEARPPLCIQSHIDMVCIKDPGLSEQFPIQLQLNENILSATGTTLGADNGIGAAAMMALISEDHIPHGPLELLFTTQEETGLDGAAAFAYYDRMRSKHILNLDSEEEKILYVGCAGGGRVEGHFTRKTTSPTANSTKYSLEISEFAGGHSGVEIHLGRGNAIKVLAEIIRTLETKEVPVQIVEITGGSAMNAIPKSANATIMVAEAMIPKFTKEVAEIIRGVYLKYKAEKPTCKVTKQSLGSDDTVLTPELQQQLLMALQQLPHGVITMEPNDPTLTRTSNNVGVLTTSDDAIVVTSMFRSSSSQDLVQMDTLIESIFMDVGARVVKGSAYAPWEPQFDSMLLTKVRNSAEKIFGEKVQVKTMHAGLECAVFSKKIPGAQIVSFGPTMRHVHTTKEWVDVDSVDRFWDLLLHILRQ